MSKVIFDYEYETEEEIVTYNVSAKIKAYNDNYGEDADGNRGKNMCVIDSVEIEYILDEDGEEIILSDEEEECVCEKAVEVWHKGVC